ncbi:hypothetical protein RM530_06080 [Algiphilus sp. W345]|uniref:Uncharacterized protein n=1 Tax=Banduia mediterranea TaxID=3075609 RepID=A0ABU2WHC6_9GAMM|nr:hypothetical protein [Algiphilus sp. W345]MDT0496933.1 hypothetical protein [Algiphilus sp. W345]
MISFFMVRSSRSHREVDGHCRSGKLNTGGPSHGAAQRVRAGYRVPAMNAFELRTERLLIRAWSKDDRAGFSRLVSDPKICK